jgi:hypothetical protein
MSEMKYRTIFCNALKCFVCVTTAFPFLSVCFVELEILARTCGRIESFVRKGFKTLTRKCLGTNFCIFNNFCHFYSNSFSA